MEIGFIISAVKDSRNPVIKQDLNWTWKGLNGLERYSTANASLVVSKHPLAPSLQLRIKMVYFIHESDSQAIW